MKHAVVVLVLAVACGKGESKRADDRVASCYLESMHSCREYRGDNLALGSDSLAELCTVVAPAKFTMTPCPTTNIIATCTKREGKDFFYAGYVDASTIESNCAANAGTYAK